MILLNKVLKVTLVIIFPLFQIFPRRKGGLQKRVVKASYGLAILHDAKHLEAFINIYECAAYGDFYTIGVHIYIEMKLVYRTVCTTHVLSYLLTLYD